MRSLGLVAALFLAALTPLAFCHAGEEGDRPGPEGVPEAEHGEGHDGEAENPPGGEDESDGMRPGLVAHYFKDPTEWDGNWKEGRKPGVAAEDWTFRAYRYSRIEPLVNHLFIRRGWFSVRWVGYLKVPPGRSDGNRDGDGDNEDEGGEDAARNDPEFTLELWMDDGARLFLDGETLVDDWRPCAESEPEAHRRVHVRLSRGFHRIVIEYFQGESLKNDDRDPAKFYWSSESLRIKRGIVPASHFFHNKEDLQDYVPSQGLAPKDLAALNGGKAPSISFKGPPAGDAPARQATSQRASAQASSRAFSKRRAHRAARAARAAPHPKQAKARSTSNRKSRFSERQFQRMLQAQDEGQASRQLTAARNYRRNRMFEQARALLQAVLANHPGTPSAQKAQRMLDRLP